MSTTASFDRFLPHKNHPVASQVCPYQPVEWMAWLSGISQPLPCTVGVSRLSPLSHGRVRPCLQEELEACPQHLALGVVYMAHLSSVNVHLHRGTKYDQVRIPNQEKWLIHPSRPDPSLNWPSWCVSWGLWSDAGGTRGPGGQKGHHLRARAARVCVRGSYGQQLAVSVHRRQGRHLPCKPTADEGCRVCCLQAAAPQCRGG